MDTSSFWIGRNDGDHPSVQRWFQSVQQLKLSQLNPSSWVFVGFESDEGVQRNKGRIGAKEAPNILRKACSNFPVFPKLSLVDAGNITCDGDLEKAQDSFSDTVSSILSEGGHSIGLGGGHEIMKAHFQGIRKAFPEAKIGIINWDAHFDNREIDDKLGPSSGTGFYEIAEKETIHSLTLGVQENSNTKALFDYANQTKMQYCTAQELYVEKEQCVQKINSFLSEIDVLYVTICMDVFSAAFAPGVSATAYNGIIPDALFEEYFKLTISSKKLKSIDIAEVNPSLDIDNRTAKLAASLLFTALQKQSQL